jgi:hypothetical protein
MHPEVMKRTAELRTSTRLQTADTIHLAATVHWDVMRCSPTTAIRNRKINLTFQGAVSKYFSSELM